MGIEPISFVYHTKCSLDAVMFLKFILVAWEDLANVDLRPIPPARGPWFC